MLLVLISTYEPRKCCLNYLIELGLLSKTSEEWCRKSKEAKVIPWVASVGSIPSLMSYTLLVSFLGRHEERGMQSMLSEKNVA